MKITCSKHDDVYEKIQLAVVEAIGDSSEAIDVHVSRGFKGGISCKIQGNDRNLFDTGKALTWEYTASVDKEGNVQTETSSWSGLQATTREQLDSLRETLRVLEVINQIDWASILSAEGLEINSSTNVGASTRIMCAVTATWQLVDHKSVPDSDGFNTDYAMYTDNSGKYICMFGDMDVYGPDEDYADWEGDSEAVAYEWFDNYEGLVDEDEDTGYADDDVYM